MCRDTGAASDVLHPSGLRICLAVLQVEWTRQRTRARYAGGLSTSCMQAEALSTGVCFLSPVASQPTPGSAEQERRGGADWLWGIINRMPAALSQKDLASLLSLLSDEER